MKKKKKKKIIKKLKSIIEKNKNFCVYHDIKPTEYIDGSNDVAKLMIKYIKKIK
jgi:hypothetical protein